MKRLSIVRASGAAALLAASSAAQCLEWNTAIGNGGLITPLGGSVRTLATYDDGGGARLYAGGYLDMPGSGSAKQVARWDGSVWTGFADLTLPGTSIHGSVSELGEFNDGVQTLLIASGRFEAANGVPARNIAAFDGIVWSALSSGLDGQARAITTFDDGGGPALYVGGMITEAGGVGVNAIAKWDGASWSGLGNGTAIVNALCVFDDGSGPALFAGGYFLPSPLGAPPIGVARFDGTTWSSVMEAPLSGLVSCLAVFDDGNGPALYAGGGFQFVGGAEAKHIAKWDGSTWSPLGKGTNSQVTSLTTWNDGTGTKLYAAGSFVQAGGKAAKHVAAWDGAQWTALREGLANDFKFIPADLEFAVHDEGLGHGPELFVSGVFEYADGDATDAIAKYGPCTPVGQPYCFGDGSLPTLCPCVPPNTVPNPSGGSDGGCANSFVASGGKLVASGTTNPDTARLLASDVTPAGFGFFIGGNASIDAGVAADDGVRCAGGAFVRFGGQNAVSGSIRYPNDLAGWSDSLSQISSVVPGSGLTRHYQLVYRDTRVGFCNPSTLNWTNAVTLIW